MINTVCRSVILMLSNVMWLQIDLPMETELRRIPCRPAIETLKMTIKCQSNQLSYSLQSYIIMFCFQFSHYLTHSTLRHAVLFWNCELFPIYILCRLDIICVVFVKQSAFALLTKCHIMCLCLMNQLTTGQWLGSLLKPWSCRISTHNIGCGRKQKLCRRLPDCQSCQRQVAHRLTSYSVFIYLCTTKLYMYI